MQILMPFIYNTCLLGVSWQCSIIPLCNVQTWEVGRTFQGNVQQRRQRWNSLETMGEGTKALGILQDEWETGVREQGKMASEK